MYVNKDSKLTNINVIGYYIPIESIKTDIGQYTKYIYGYTNEDYAIRIETADFLVEYFYKYDSDCNILYIVNLFDVKQNILKTFKEKKISELKNIYVKKAIEIKNLFDEYLETKGYIDFPINKFIIATEPHKYYNGIDELLNVARTYFLQDKNIVVKNVFSGKDSRIKGKLISTIKITGAFDSHKNKAKPDYRKSYDGSKPIYFGFTVPILKV